MTELHIGSVLANRYRIETKLGEGGMAVVYRAHDLQRRVPLAIKALKADFAEDSTFLHKFQREARSLQRLQHPNIVRFYELAEDGLLAFMVLDFIDGVTLRTVLRQRRGPLAPGEVLGYLRPICAALSYAHSERVVHCDMKPANVMVDHTGRVFVNDFGIARLSESATVTFSTPGTAAYMAPEQWRGGEEVLPATDVYALGIMLYEILTGQQPYHGETAQSKGHNREKIMWEHLHANPVPASQVNPQLPTVFDQMLVRCLAKDPAARYQSVDQLLEAFEAACRQANILEIAVPLPAVETIPTGGAQPTGAGATRPSTSPAGTQPSGSTAAVAPPPITQPRRSTANTGLLVVFGGVVVVAVVVGLLVFGGGRDKGGTSTPRAGAGAGPITQQVVQVFITATATAPHPTPTPVIPTSTPTLMPTESVILQNEEDGFQTGVTRGFVADVWTEPRVGDPGVYGDRQTQLVMGEHVIVLEETDLWYQIIAVDQPSSKDSRGYPGWVQKSDVVLGWPLASEYAIVTEPIASLFMSPGGRRLGEVPFDARLPVLEKQSQWVHVYLPDSSDGWLSLAEVRVTPDVSVLYEVGEILSTARKFMGSPYLWGGTTTRGFDCSGFLYRVFHVHGITLSRDSRDMALNGSSVSRDSLQAGDIVFTTSRSDGVVSHTALYINDGKVIETIGASSVGIQTLAQLLGVERFVSASRVTP